MTVENPSIDRRNCGVDALRLFSMLLIVVLHVLGQGGVLAAASGARGAAAWLMESAAMCAVNCFALVSGYVGYSASERRWKPAGYLRLWLGVLTYSFGITLLARLIDPRLAGGKDLLKSLLPVTTRQYWYFTAYTGVFFVMPGLNALLRGASDRELNLTAAGLLTAFSAYATLASLHRDVFNLHGGYSFVWLAALYVMGGWMRRNADALARRLKPAAVAAGIALCAIAPWACRWWQPGLAKALYLYTSPAMLLMAAGLVWLFSRLSVGGRARTFVRAFSPAAFGVYLIHTHPLPWAHLIKGRFAWIAGFPAWLLPLLVLGCALGVFAVCLAIEKLRLTAFKGLERAAASIGAAVKRRGR